MKYKKGDVVKVYSLQSFHGGGFINGKEGVVYQDQTEGSVLVTVERKIDGNYRIDRSYEVYPQQLRLIKRPKKKEAIERFNEFIKELKSY